ncbi:3-hydroxy-9,10-secoandrosta-1,3,5(10)-triene-9,17-dione monooxygenase oxygenase subunit [Nocardia camponoti]|uniref:Flavin-dependent monooxygenase, oxygenase subunit HsaA n=1 Tax=Nocardia camponoti TaxID=1616106 RepID=A0A917V5I6_9NOCA|nr:3-hydroxy-9,10-secoandrosta-1,3,5(10)-triene-9,17-dione monooxygenase oxygenase subunit [Nocardia camponoti]GGK40712.1 acyl-CoA dehydrogenase [Nocardia camponoti]
MSHSVEQVLSAVEELLPTLRERAEEAEDLRRVPEASVKALADTGFFKLLQPKRYGGHEAHPVAFYTAVKKIASACGSTGWVAGILGVHPWNLALFDDAAQQEVWGVDQNVLISSSYAPMGKSEVVEGGYKLSGRWSFSSGSDHCTWALLGGPVMKDGEPVDLCTYLVPISDYSIVDTWDTFGLRGTGSNDIVVKDVFVPEHRALSFRHTAKCQVPGQAVNPGPLYRMPFGSIHPSVIAAPIIGMATGAYDAYLEHQGQRVRAAYAGEKAKDDPFTSVRVAEVASEIDAAWLQLTDNIRQEWEFAQQGEAIPLELRLRVRRDQVHGTQRAVAAIDKMMDSSGARVMFRGASLQRFWRDAHAGRLHASNDPERSYQMYGASEFEIFDGNGMY